MNKRVLLAKRPEGRPDESTWELEEHPIPVIGEGEFLIQNEYVSIDPSMRGWIKDAKSYFPLLQIGDVMRGATVGKVIESDNSNINAGDHYAGLGGVHQYFATDAKGLQKVDPNWVLLPKYLSVLGIHGLKAYFGDTVLGSGTAGMVGSTVSQITKINGCHVASIAGGHLIKLNKITLTHKNQKNEI